MSEKIGFAATNELHAKNVSRFRNFFQDDGIS